MAIQVRKKEEAQDKAPELEVKEAEVVSDDAEVNVKLPEMNDKFLMSSGNAMAWLMEHRRMVILGVSLVVIGCLSVIGVLNFKESQMVERSSMLSDYIVTLNAPTEELANLQEAYWETELRKAGINAATVESRKFTYKVPDETTRFETVDSQIPGVVKMLHGETLEPLAVLMQGGAAMHVGKAEEAQKAFKGLSGGSSDVRLFALLGEAETLIQQDKYDEAIAKYEDLKKIGAGYASYATLSQGRAYEVKGDTENAVKAYLSVIREHSQPQDHAYAESRLDRLSPNWKSQAAEEAAPAAAPVAGTVPGAGF